MAKKVKIKDSINSSIGEKAGLQNTASTTTNDLQMYYSLILLAGKKLKNFESDKRNETDICSLNESKFLKLAKGRPKEFCSFNKKFLSRIYPSRTRLMSSNFNPMIPWMYGCQIVALNYQALGIATILNRGRFVENGKCGYVLKPDVLRKPEYHFDPTDVNLVETNPILLEIQISSGHQLPRPSNDQRKEGKNRGKQASVRKVPDTSCPYVTASVHGVKADCKTFRTNSVSNNGFNPRWNNQKFTFEISCPSVAMLLFEVRNQDAVRSDFLAAAAMPVSCIRPGFRWVELYDGRLRRIEWSGLLVNAQIKPLQLENARRSGRYNTGANASESGLAK